MVRRREKRKVREACDGWNERWRNEGDTGERWGKSRMRERKNERVVGDLGYIWKRECQRRAYCPYRPAPESLLPNGAGVKGK